MLNFKQIQQQYPKDMHVFERGLLREYLQYLILSIIFTSKHSSKLSFLGETALRVVYGVNRFSEDLDFDNKDLSFDEFQELSNYIKSELEKEGFEVTITTIAKSAFHAHIKFPEVLYSQGLSPLKEEKLKISVDTFDQGVLYSPEAIIIDKFEIFKRILVTPKSVIFAQKLWTITERKRAKGRDFFDIMSLANNTEPDRAFLEAKFGVSDCENIIEIIREHIQEIDFSDLARDVAPFLINQRDVERIELFPDYLGQISW